MVLGFIALAFGYSLFYWGYHHFPGQQRYSLYALLGFGNLFKNFTIPAGTPVQFKS